jgi:predicted outer membrane protein
MIAAQHLKATNFRLIFLLTIILCITSCKKNNPIETALKNETFTKTEKEEIEAFFFIATANVSKSIISKSEIAQQKSSDFTIQELSKKIETEQTEILQEISKIANKKLIIITEINATHKRDLYDLIDSSNEDFDKTYLVSMTESIKEQIGLLESISKQTNDKTILKLVLQYLPEQYQILREMQRINNEIN